MLAGLHRAIVRQQERCDEVWLVVHFFDTFLVLQDFLGAAGLEYQIVDRPIHGFDLSTDEQVQAGVVRLVLSSFVVEPAPEEVRTVSAGSRRKSKADKSSIAMIVCERHPHFIHDKRLLEVSKQIDATITFGYVLSLEDVVVRSVVSPMALEVLKQLGLDDNEMIASHYLSRLLERRLIREGSKYTDNQEAESAAQWIELNSR